MDAEEEVVVPMEETSGETSGEGSGEKVVEELVAMAVDGDESSTLRE